MRADIDNNDLTEHDLRDAARFVALKLGQLDLAAGRRVLADLVARLDSASPAVAGAALDDLLQHLEVMAPADQERSLRWWLELRDDGDDQMGIGRLLKRLPAQRRAEVADRLGVAIPAPAQRHTPPVAGDADAPLVALVVPAYLSADSFLQPPVGMLLAAARLRRLGYRVRLVDNRVGRLAPEDLVADVADARVIVVTTTPYDHIQNYFLDYRLRHALRTIDALKTGVPGATVVACGAHGTVRPDIVLRDCRADLVLKGEFDAAIPPLVEAIVNGTGLASQSMVVTRDEAVAAPDAEGASGRWRVTSLRQHGSADLDDAEVLPAYDLIDFEDYYGDHYVLNRPTRVPRWGAVLATRGCAFDCSFCYNFWDRRMRYREPEAVVDELRYLQGRGVSGLFFIDFHFTQNKRWVTELCRLIRESGVRIPWSAQVRSDSVPDDVLAEMAAAGCSDLWFGVESFDPGIVSSLEKYREADVARSAVRRTTAAGIQPHLFIMIGVPGETRASIDNTLAEMHDLQAPYCGVMPATPRFGTRYYELAKAQFPQLGDDFYGLRAVRGLVGNDLRPVDLDEALAAFANRGFLYDPVPPRLALH
jgi:radical SAM superfamily enzyme YgiQ (UPF0313 family)